MNGPEDLCVCDHRVDRAAPCTCSRLSQSPGVISGQVESFSSSDPPALNDLSSLNSAHHSPERAVANPFDSVPQRGNANLLIPELDDLSTEEQILDINEFTNIGQLNTYLRTRYGYPPFLPILRSTYLSDIEKLFLAVQGRFKEHSTLVRVWIKNISEAHGATLPEIQAQIESTGARCTTEELDSILSGNFLEANGNEGAVRSQDSRAQPNVASGTTEGILLPELNWESFQYFMDQDPSERLNEVDPKMLSIPSSESDEETQKDSRNQVASGASGAKNQKQYQFLTSSRSRAQTYFKATRRMIQKAKQIEQQTGAIVFMAVARPTNLRNAVFHISDNIKSFEPEAGVVSACSKMFQRYVASSEDHKVSVFKQLKDQNRVIKEQAKELERIKMLLASQPTEPDKH